MKNNTLLYLIAVSLLAFSLSCGKKKPTPPTPTPPPYQVTNFKAIDSNSIWAKIYDTLTTDGSFLAVIKTPSTYELIKINQQGQVIWTHQLNHSYSILHILEPNPNQYLVFADNELYEFDQNGNLVQNQAIVPIQEFVKKVFKRPNGFLLFVHQGSNNIKYRTFNSSWIQTDVKELPFDRPSNSVIIDDKIVNISIDSLPYPNAPFGYGLCQIRYDLNFNRIDSVLVEMDGYQFFGSYFNFLQLKVLRNNDLFLFSVYGGTDPNADYSIMRGTSNIRNYIEIPIPWGTAGLSGTSYAFNEFDNNELYLFRGNPYYLPELIHSNSNHSDLNGQTLEIDTSFTNKLNTNDHELSYSSWPMIIQEPGTLNMFVFEHFKTNSINAIIYKVNSSGLVPF